MPRELPMAAILLILASTSLLGDVVETGSSRFILVMNQGGEVIDGPTQIDSTITYGAFNEVVQSSAWSGTHGGSSESYQDSNVSNGVYDVHFEIGTDAAGGIMGNDIATGYTEAFFEVFFTLDAATDFNISGTYNSWGEINGAVSDSEIRIDRISGGVPIQVVAFATNTCCPSVDHDGTLEPGDYAFRAHALGIVDHSFMMSYNTSTSGINVTMTLDVPQEVPGDMDCSGTVDIGDVAPFVQAVLDPDGYDAAFPNCNKDLADMNADSVRDGSDVGLFVADLLAP